MAEKNTSELDNILKSAKPEDFSKIQKEDIGENLPALSDYLNEYIGQHGLLLSDVIGKSLLSPNYAYALFNGNKKNPTRDRVIALCLSMHMNLEEVQRTLKICSLGALYSKNKRDALLIICFNTGQTDVMKVNAFLNENGLDILETSKEAKENTAETDINRLKN